MDDLDLLIFGCAVSFIAAAGFYVYLRACFTGKDERLAAEHSEGPRASDARSKKVRDIA